jgi:hypothetical protein
MFFKSFFEDFKMVLKEKVQALLAKLESVSEDKVGLAVELASVKAQLAVALGNDKADADAIAEAKSEAKDALAKVEAILAEQDEVLKLIDATEAPAPEAPVEVPAPVEFEAPVVAEAAPIEETDIPY